MHSLVVDATRPQTRAYLVHPTKECREPWRRISLEEEYNLHRDLPQVTFLRELMLRQKVCFAKRKEFKYFPKKNNPELWDSSQFSHFFSHLGDPGDYYRYVAVLLPDKFYWSMKKKKNLPLSSEGVYAASHIAKLRILSCISGTLKRINMVGDLRSCPISSIILPERIALNFAMLSLY